MISRVNEQGRALTASLLVLISLSTLSISTALADVQCVWNGSSYTCSGEGYSVIVSGGGLPPVVTNIVGVCTNCSNIAPQDLKNLCSEISRGIPYCISDIEGIKDLASNIIGYNQELIDDIDTYQTFNIRTDSDNLFTSNYMYTVDNNQASAMKSYYESALISPLRPSPRISAAESFGNGIYQYANTSVKPTLQRSIDYAESIKHDLDGTIAAFNTIDDIVEQIDAGATECIYSTNNVPSSTNDTTAAERWCTYDQGEAIKALLQELSDHAQSQFRQLQAISNYTYQAVQTIKSGLFSDYTHIPTQAQLGDTWENVYLAGNGTSWGYDPTNILARIELLLYGMSGVGTNDAYYADETISSDNAYDTFDDAKTEITTAFADVRTDLDTRPYETLGQSLISFISAFECPATQLVPDVALIDSITLRQSGSGASQSVSVPSIQIGPESVGVFNSFASISHSVFTIIYAAGYAVLTFLFWKGYAFLGVKAFKWIVEIISSFLSS